MNGLNNFDQTDREYSLAPRVGWTPARKERMNEWTNDPI